MVDTPTTNYGLRTQELGSNIATWGDPNLNEVENCIDQILGRIKPLTITGAYTITSTNYVTTADNKNAGWDFTGTLTAAANIIIPATNTRFHVENNTTGGFSITPKTSAGTGITVPNGRIAWLRCNGTNVVNAFPTHMGTTFVPSLPGDVANVSYVQTAIANATLPASAGTLLVSGSDTTAGYLAAKLVAGTDITLTASGAGNETLTAAAVPYWNTPRALAFANSPITALDRDVLLLNTSGGAITVNLPASGRIWIADTSGNANTNNITLTPAGGSTITFGTIDTAYFGGVYRLNSTNWDLN